MWYLISVSIYGFINVVRRKDETNFKYKGKEENVPVFDASNPFAYITEIEDEYAASDYGDTISKIISELKPQIILLHFDTFLVRFHGTVDELMKIVKGNVGSKDTVTIAEITHLHTENYSAQESEMIDFMLKK